MSQKRESRVLIAEADTIIRLDVRSQLERADYVVCAEARDGEEAVELARESRPDVAILDVKMPKLDGIDAARRIRTARTVTRKVALDYAHAHSPVERANLEIFAEHGPVMRFSDVTAGGAVHGLNRATVAVYLTRMPSVVRLRRGVYAVRGAV
jgi:CheY-like chemotaxis protein